MVRLCFSIGVMVLACGCASFDPARYPTYETNREYAGTLDFHGVPLDSGQIVVSRGGGAVSFLSDLMATEYSRYGHSGILSIEGGVPYVYEALATLNMRFWQPPTARLSGHVRRVPLTDFIKRNTVVSIYAHDNVNLAKVAESARGAYRGRLAFDGYFDYRSREAVYCNEFVARMLEAAGHSKVPVTPRTTNASLSRAMQWLEIDTPGFILGHDLVTDATRVGRFSKRYSAKQLAARQAFYENMHQRFNDQQRLGDVFRWGLVGPRVRPHLKALFEQVMAEAEQHQGASVHWVAARLHEVLGPTSAHAQRLQALRGEIP